MPEEQDLSEDFSETLLNKYLLLNPQEARKVAIEYYRKNYELQRACYELCESSNKLNADFKNFLALQEKMIVEYKKTKTSLHQISFMILLVCFFVPLISICFVKYVR